MDAGERVSRALAVPFVAALGPELVDPEVPAAGVFVRFGEPAGNGVGGAHAAALSAVMELAGYLAVAPALADDEHAVTIAASLQIVRPTPLGALVQASGVLDGRTRRTAFVTVAALVDVEDDTDEVVARTQLTKAITTLR